MAATAIQMSATFLKQFNGKDQCIFPSLVDIFVENFEFKLGLLSCSV